MDSFGFFLVGGGGGGVLSHRESGAIWCAETKAQKLYSLNTKALLKSKIICL